MIKQYDVLIVGAGPAGCACALSLKDSGLSVAMVDKESFPRDKVCGDALSADVINQLYQFFPDQYKSFIKLKGNKPSYGVRFTSPNGYEMAIPFTGRYPGMVPGYISPRLLFDHFLLQSTLDSVTNLDFYPGQQVHRVKDNTSNIEISSTDYEFAGKMVVAADGAYSIVAKQLSGKVFSRSQSCAGIRGYFEHVTGFDAQSSIELHFFKEVIPGYFWVFPMEDNKANVGLGILSSVVAAKKLNLKKLADDLIHRHPKLKSRFKNAQLQGGWKGHIIPLGTEKFPVSGHRFLLTGDAAGLTDPLTGEGIGNALRSGRYAANHVLECFQTNRFDVKFNLQYDRFLYKKIWRELKVSHSLQKMLKYPFLFDFIVKKAAVNESVRKIITSMLDDIDLKKELTRSSFYIKLLFKN